MPDEIYDYGIALLPWVGMIAGLLLVCAICKQGCMHVLFA